MNEITVKDLLTACEGQSYLMLEENSGYEFAINARVGQIVKKHGKANLGKPLNIRGFRPCSFHEYISNKHPFINTP